MAGEFTKISVMLQLWSLVNIIVQACDPPCLYFSAGRTIKSIELSSKKITSNVTVPQAHDGRVLAVAVDVEEKILYWSDQVSRTIKRIHLQSGKIEVVASEVGHCEGIAIEWVNKYIYWTDNKNGRIEMSRVNGSDRRVLFDRDVQNPRGITVDPVYGYIFWTDYGDDPKIERATLAGQERTTIIANSISSRLKYPNDVIVDYTDNKIYWVDAGLDVVGTANLDGHNVKISEPITNSHLFAVALHNNTLYITDSETNAKSIRVIEKESLKEIFRFTSSMIGSRDLLGLTMLHESRQPPVISPCSHGNGGCSHLCFIVPDGYRCGCPNGTALREDGYSCQEANFTNCRNQPCQNGGTCYFNFHSFSDDCTCSEYYAGKDCGLYLGLGAVSITLEMAVKEWEEEKFKEAIMQGLYDYCMGDHCSLSNKAISKQFCPSFLNNSAFGATQVTVIGQPGASLPNHTKVDFAVILRPDSSSKPLVVVNTTLEHIVRERANSISKHLNKIVFVNNLHPSLDVRCNEEDVKPVEKGEKTKSRNNAKAVGITSVGAILLVSVVVAVWYWRKRHIVANQQRGNHEEENDGGYEFVLMAEQRDNNGEGNDGGYEFVPIAGQRDNQQRGNNEVGIDGGCVFVPEASHRIVIGKYLNNTQASFGGEINNRNIVDNQQRENLNRQQSAAGYEDMSSPQGLSMPQETSSGTMESRDIPGNQHRENSKEQDCEVRYENEVADENDNQQSEGAYEDTGASQALAVSLETFDGARAVLLQSATGRQAVENDDEVSGTYNNPVQCTDDIKKNPH